MPPLVRDLIDAARIRHWSFANAKLGDGALLMFLNQRQRAHLAAVGPSIESVVGQTIEYDLGLPTTTTSGHPVILIGGIPAYVTTSSSGYLVYLSPGGIPYIDPGAIAPLSVDPFGISGTSPGWPLPTELVRLINVGLVYGGGIMIPCDVIPEKERFTHLPGRNPAAFISANRLIPLLPMHGGAPANTSDRWNSVTAIQISFVALQVLTGLDDAVMLPTLLTEALTADLAVLLAGQSANCTPADRAFFVAEAARCMSLMLAAANDLFDSVQQSHVLYKR